MVPASSYLADVGADHGKLGIYLLSNNIVKRVQSIENKPGPFCRMKANYEDANLSNKVDFSLSDGLTDLRQGVDTVVIAGVGGLLTNKILTADVSKLARIKTIIVDPHRDTYEVRKQISLLGYEIVDEKLVYEDKIYYSIIRFDKVGNPVEYSEDELLFGPVLLKNRNDLFTYFLRDQIDKIDKILKSNIPLEKREYYLHLKERINSIL